VNCRAISTEWVFSPTEEEEKGKILSEPSHFLRKKTISAYFEATPREKRENTNYDDVFSATSYHNVIFFVTDIFSEKIIYYIFLPLLALKGLFCGDFCASRLSISALSLSKRAVESSVTMMPAFLNLSRLLHKTCSLSFLQLQLWATLIFQKWPNVASAQLFPVHIFNGER